jgi:hypothetical protein
MKKGKKINPAKRLRLRLAPPALMRLLTKVKVDPDTGCWEWLGHRDRHGYGQAKIAGRAMWVHRVFYAVFVRSISDGREIDHGCHNPCCCNPAHLKQQTVARNRASGNRHRAAVAVADEGVAPF